MENQWVTTEDIEKWIDIGEDEFNITTFRISHNIDSEDPNFGTYIHRLCQRRAIKRTKPGWYRKIKQVEPLKVKGATSEEYFPISFPKSHTDYSTFGFEDILNVSQGDLIVIAGTSNAGKTTLAHNFLAENADNLDVVLMGNEYRSNDGYLLPKYLRRFKRFEWAKLINGTGDLTFTLLPVDENYEDYVIPDKLNIIDWLGLAQDWHKMGAILKEIKNSVGSGVVIVVLQKKHGVQYGYGAEMTEHYADVYMTIDPLGRHESRVTLGKVKEPKGRVKLYGRMWGFETTDGSNIINIREIEKCKKCWGKGYKTSGKCDTCIEKGYVDLELDSPV